MDDDELYPLEEDEVPVTVLVSGISSATSSASSLSSASASSFSSTSQHPSLGANFTPTLFNDKSVPVPNLSTGLSTFGRVPLPHIHQSSSLSSSSSHPLSFIPSTSKIPPNSAALPQTSTFARVSSDTAVGLPSHKSNVNVLSTEVPYASQEPKPPILSSLASSSTNIPLHHKVNPNQHPPYNVVPSPPQQQPSSFSSNLFNNKPVAMNNSLSSNDSVSSGSDTNNHHAEHSSFYPPQHHHPPQSVLQPFPSPATPQTPHTIPTTQNFNDFTVSPVHNPLSSLLPSSAQHPRPPPNPSPPLPFDPSVRTDLPLWLRTINTVTPSTLLPNPHANFPLSNTWLTMLLDTSLWTGVWDPVIAIKHQLPQYEQYGLPEQYTQDIPDECQDQQEFISTLRLYNIYNLLHAQKPAFSGVISLIVRIRSIHPTGEINWTAWVEDPTGFMLAMLWKQVMEEYGKQLRKGSVLLLRNVSVFCMGEPQILSIKTNNIVRIWNADEPDGRLM